MSTRSHRIWRHPALSALVAILAVSPVVLAALTSVPSLLRDESGEIAWVSSDVAVRNGILQEDYLQPYLAKLQRDARVNRNAAGAPECRAFRTFSTDHFQPRGSVEELTSNAKLVVSGKVVELRQGFLRGHAGTLIRISGSYLKGRAVAEVYLFYPIAVIETNEGAICTRPVGDFTPPQIGDRLLVFSIVGDQLLDGVSILYADPTHELVHESMRGTTRLPKALRSSGKSLDDVLRETRSHVNATRVP